MSPERPRVLVALPIFRQVLDALGAHFEVDAPCGTETPIAWTPTALASRLQGCAGIFVASEPRIDAALLEACPSLRAVCSMAVGYNNIDVPACTAHRVWVTNAPGVLTETTADLGFALMMAAARRVGEGERVLRAGKWTHWRYDMLAGADVYGATLGVLGMGRIGQAIARRGARGFAMPVIYHNRRRLDPGLEQQLGARWVGKAELLAACDHLVIVVPYTPDSHHLIGAAELALMKPTATLTHIARGGVVDDAALAVALRERRIAAAGLDVYEGEPAVHPGLLAVPNVVLTPHIGSASMPTRRAMADLAARNLVAILAGATPAPLTPLNRPVG